MEQKLNSEQKKLVEENHELIYQFMDDYHLKTDSVEDWYGTCAVGLCLAALSYSGGNFRYIAYQSMREECLGVLRNELNAVASRYDFVNK